MQSLNNNKESLNRNTDTIIESQISSEEVDSTVGENTFQNDSVESVVKEDPVSLQGNRAPAYDWQKEFLNVALANNPNQNEVGGRGRFHDYEDEIIYTQNVEKMLKAYVLPGQGSEVSI